MRRFADWSWNGPEYLRLLEIENGLAGLILQDKKAPAEADRKIDLDDWLSWWALIVAPPDGASYNDMPFWIKVVPRVFFLAINSSGSGMISKKELAAIGPVGLVFITAIRLLHAAHIATFSIIFY